VWVRGIADLIIIDDENLTAWVADWKTGNNKYPDRDQLVLMSIMVFAHFPHIRRVNSALMFIVKNDMVKMSMSSDEVATSTGGTTVNATLGLSHSFEQRCMEPKPNTAVRLVSSKNV
jgi:hypothetical protein